MPENEPGTGPREKRQVERLASVLRDVLDFSQKSSAYVESVAWYLYSHGWRWHPYWAQRAVYNADVAALAGPAGTTDDRRVSGRGPDAPGEALKLIPGLRLAAVDPAIREQYLADLRVIEAALRSAARPEVTGPSREAEAARLTDEPPKRIQPWCQECKRVVGEDGRCHTLGCKYGEPLRPEAAASQRPMLDKFTEDGEWEWVLDAPEGVIVTIPTGEYEYQKAHDAPAPIRVAEIVAEALALAALSPAGGTEQEARP